MKKPTVKDKPHSNCPKYKKKKNDVKKTIVWDRIFFISDALTGKQSVTHGEHLFEFCLHIHFIVGALLKGTIKFDVNIVAECTYQHVLVCLGLAFL